MLALLSTMAIAKGDGDEGLSATYFGLTITCRDGEIAEKVSSNYSSREIQIIAGGTYTISGTRSQNKEDWNEYSSAPTREVISVTATEEVTLILNNVTIQAPNFDMQGYQVGGIVCGENSNVHIVLQGTNTLDMSTYYNNSRSTGSAGIGLKNNAKLVISGSGSLVAKGGQNHPGIGMLTRNSNGNITINGGTIYAASGMAEGIGAGSGGKAGTVSISGTAAVTAFSRSALAIHEKATVEDRSILNVQFISRLPGSINLLEGGTAAGSLSDIPNGAKAFAYTFPSAARELRIQDGTEGREQYFAVYKDGADSKDIYSLPAEGMLTKKGLTWEEKQPTGFTITASAGANGSISPSGEVSVEADGSQTFTITANEGYKIADVLVDGKSVGAVGSYTFSGVQAKHTIEATFAYDMPTVGFKVRMNPHMGSQFEVAYTENGEILDIDLGTYVSAYLRPYIEGVNPNNSSWGKHVYYTYEFRDVVDGSQASRGDPFYQESIYNRANTGSGSKVQKITVKNCLTSG